MVHKTDLNTFFLKFKLLQLAQQSEYSSKVLWPDLVCACSHSSWSAWSQWAPGHGLWFLKTFHLWVRVRDGEGVIISGSPSLFFSPQRLFLKLYLYAKVYIQTVFHTNYYNWIIPIYILQSLTGHYCVYYNLGSVSHKSSPPTAPFPG